MRISHLASSRGILQALQNVKNKLNILMLLGKAAFGTAVSSVWESSTLLPLSPCALTLLQVIGIILRKSRKENEGQFKIPSQL